MRKTLFIILVFITTLGYGQQGRYGGKAKGPSVTGKVTGVLADAASNEVLPYASVVLRNPQNEKDIGGTITQDNGSFKLVAVPVGTYELLVSFVGYEVKRLPVTLTLKKPDYNLGRILLNSTSTNLQEVVVTGEKELVESKIDRMVYNAEQDVANAGGDASDVLRRAPLLNVDLEGNVSLRGSSNIQILINGKPSSMFATSPADALKVIPADQIKSVEVITTPSAKYDGEGTAGIVNIITKKKNIEGVAGNIDLSVGNRSNRGVIGLNAGKGRFGFNANASTFYSWPRNGESTFYREDEVEGGSRILEESGIQRSDRLGFFGTVGAFYDFNAYHSLSSSLRFRGRKRNSDDTFDASFVDPANSISQQYQRISENDDLFSGYELSLDYLMKFPNQDGRELSFAFKIDGEVRRQDFAINQQDLQGVDQELFRDETNTNDGDNLEEIFQMDYVHPIGEKVKIEAGGRAVIRDLLSDFEYQYFDRGINSYVIDGQRTNEFNYDQNVMAGYLSSNVTLGSKYGLVAGARYEVTEISGAFLSGEGMFSNSYGNLLPSIIVSRKLGKLNTLKASYNRRIQRPGLRFINPYTEVNNNRNISIGNPELDPELTDKYEIGYNAFIKGVMLNASVYYNQTRDVIESFLDIDDEGVSVTTYKNIGNNNSVGLNLFTSATIFKIWTLRGGVNMFSYSATGVVDGESLSNSAFLWSGNLNSNIKLGRDWTVDMFGFYRARRQTIQGVNPSFSIFSMGVRKEIWDKKGSIGMRIVEPFFENKTFVSELSGDGFFQTSERQIPFRSFGITFSYKFGKVDFKQRQRRTKIKNEDQKNGDDGGQQF